MDAEIEKHADAIVTLTRLLNKRVAEIVKAPDEGISLGRLVCIEWALKGVVGSCFIEEPERFFDVVAPGEFDVVLEQKVRRPKAKSRRPRRTGGRGER